MEKIAGARKIICVAGPTACGKTDLALGLARELGGEIISADSRQIYKKLNAGTAKPARDEAGRFHGIAYHLVDELDPRETFDAGRFSRWADKIAAEIAARGRVPIITGGTGLYLRAFLDGLSPLPPRDESIRKNLEEIAARMGRAELHRRLTSADPIAAAAIPPNNIQRVIRAIEVQQICGKPISEFWKADPPRPRKFDALILIIDREPGDLRQRIVSRCLDMWPKIITEVRALVPSLYQGAEPGFQSIGYREAVAVLRGDIGLNDGLDIFTQKTLAYAKRQRTWFRGQINGLLIPGYPEQHCRHSSLAAAKKFLAGR
ncbi:MAG: tRNA (adenosine(37)-N6)-dimethylallyltransferase MiaA [Elusimicrobiota bacterium]